MISSYSLMHETEKSFVRRIAKEKPLYIYQSRNRENKPVWYILKSDEKTMFQLKAIGKEKYVDIRDFGIILSFGFGDFPSPEIIKKFSDA